MQRDLGHRAGREELTELAADLGSDVPFLLHGGNAIGGGRGETISPVLGRGCYYWVSRSPTQGLSTPAVYAEFDRLNGGADLPQPQAPGRPARRVPRRRCRRAR